MTLPACSTCPDELDPSFWEKKKGALPERHELLVRLKALHRQHQAIDWKLLDSGWTQGPDSVPRLDQAFERRERLAKGALRDLQREAGAARTAAKAWEKGAARPTLDAARAIAGAAEALVQAIDAALAELAAQHQRARAQLARDEKARAASSDSDGDDEDDEPADLLLDPRQLLQQLRRCRREPERRMSFAFIEARGDAPAVLAMHPRLSARRLFAKTQAAAGRRTGTFGKGWIQDESLMLQIDKPIPGLVRKVRPAVKVAGFRIARVVLAQADGSVFEEDVAEEGEDGDDRDDEHDPDDDRAAAEDADAVRWRQAVEHFAPLVAAALAAGHGDTARLAAIWRFARDKAASGQYVPALSALRILAPLLGTAPADATMPAGDATADAARDGQVLLQSLKARFQTFKDAFDILPDRAQEGTRLIHDVPQHVGMGDLAAARAAMSLLEALVKDAERHLQAHRDVELRMAVVTARYLRLNGLSAGAEVRQLRAAYEDIAALIDAQVRRNAFIDALPLVDILEARLRDLEAWGRDHSVRTGRSATTDRSGTAMDAMSSEEQEALEKTPELARARWDQEIAASQRHIASVQDCGPTEPALDALREAFLRGLARARSLALLDMHARALLELETARVHADRFLRGKAAFDARRALELQALRTMGAGRDPLPDLAGEALGAEAATPAVEQAMKNDPALGKNQGLIALVDRSKQVDTLFAACRARPSSVTAIRTLSAIGRLLALAAAYMAQYPSGARSATARQKHQQAAKLDIHHRLQGQYLEALMPVLTELDAIDPEALALAPEPDRAALAIGRLDALLTTNASPAVKAAIGARRLDIIGALMAAATTRDGVRRAAEVGSPAIRDAFDRQVAFGPLRDTIERSQAWTQHLDTRLQGQADVENVDRSRLLANRLVADDGSFDAVALYLFDVAEIADESASSRQMAHSLSLLAKSGEAQMALLSIEAPPHRSNAARLVRGTLGLPGDTPLTAAHARRAALAALLSELRQADVGSCFGTQVAIRIHDTDPATCLRDIAQMMAEGRITRRLPDGTQAMARIETGMSEAALRECTLTLTHADPCALIGSSRAGMLPYSVTLDAAPGFRSAMAAIGIAEDDVEDAMAEALGTLKGSRLFARDQNFKAVMRGVESIRDADLRAKVIKRVLPRITHHPDVVRRTLDAAMSHADPTAVPAAEQVAVRMLFDSVLQSTTFDIEPIHVIEALILCRLGLGEDDVERADDCDELRAELAAHPDIRSAKVLARPADADLLDQLDELRTGTDAIDWAAIGQLKSMRRDAFAAFRAESQNLLLRSWEYTLTALAERASSDRAMQALQRIQMGVVDDEAHELAARIIESRGFRGAGVGARGTQDIVQRLMASYREVFAAGTSAGYDAAARADVSEDGESAGGAWCLYDIQGIDDPDQWIRIEDADAYGRLMQGMIMLAWKRTFGKEKDPAIAAMSRRIADELSDRLPGEEFAERLARAFTKEHLGVGVEPWRLDSGGVAGNANEVLDGRPPVTFAIVAPADDIDLVGRLGAYLKMLWKDPGTGLKAFAERHGDMATVSVNCFGVHGFSLVPGAPAFARLLDDPRNFRAALDEHLALDRAKWNQALDGTSLRTRDDVAQQTYSLLGRDTPGVLIDEIWNGIRGNPTMRFFYDKATRVHARGDQDRLSEMEVARARHAIEHLVPPVPAARLEHKLGKVARALAVPPQRTAAVVRTAQAALMRINATCASMIDIRAEMAASMRAHGLDDAEVQQGQVSAALREPAGLIFADSNWGDAAHRIKFALVVHPFTGEPQVWHLGDDNSGGRPVDPAMFVHRTWEVMT